MDTVTFYLDRKAAKQVKSKQFPLSSLGVDADAVKEALSQSNEENQQDDEEEKKTRPTRKFRLPEEYKLRFTHRESLERRKAPENDANVQEETQDKGETTVEDDSDQPKETIYDLVYREKPIPKREQSSPAIETELGVQKSERLRRRSKSDVGQSQGSPEGIVSHTTTMIPICNQGEDEVAVAPRVLAKSQPDLQHKTMSEVIDDFKEKKKKKYKQREQQVQEMGSILGFLHRERPQNHPDLDAQIQGSTIIHPQVEFIMPPNKAVETIDEYYQTNSRDNPAFKKFKEITASLKDAVNQERVRAAMTPRYERPVEGRTFNILSFDGGGIKGGTHPIIVKRICEKIPHFLQTIDLFAGTSAGAAVAGTLAYGYTAQFSEYIYDLGAEKTFKKKSKGITTAIYSPDFYNYVSSIIFADAKLRDLKRKLLIPSWKLHGKVANANTKYAAENIAEYSWGPHFFHNFADDEDSGSSELLRDVISRSAAAPIFFPSYQGYVDGGIFANNPLTVALPFLTGERDGSPRIPVTKIRVISLGSGTYPHKVDTDVNWGIVQWGPKLMKLLSDGQKWHADQICRMTLGDKYFRLDPLMEDYINLDDPDNVPKIKETAQTADISKLLEFIQNSCV